MMLLTLDDNKMKIPFSIAARGEHYWSSAQMCLRHPWFLVGYEAVSDDAKEH